MRNTRFIKQGVSIMIMLSPLLFRAMLDVVYVLQLQPIYSFTGYLNSPTALSYTLSWVFLLPFLFIHQGLVAAKNFSSTVGLLFLFAAVVPHTSLFAFAPVGYSYFAQLFVFWILFFVLIRFPLPSFYVNIRGRVVGGEKLLLLAVALIFVAVIVLISFRHKNLRLWINLYDVYKHRWDIDSWNIGTITRYLLTASGVVVPFFILLSVDRKRYVLAALLFLVVMLNYGIAGHKSVLFLCVLSFVGYFFFRYARVKYLGLGMLLLPVLSLLEERLLGSYHILTMGINRGLFTLAQITQNVYVYFSEHEKDYYRQKFLRRFGFESPYAENVDHLIGRVFYNDPDVGANNGLFSDAYLNLGVWGAVVIPVILVVILKLFDKCVQHLSEKFLLGLMVSVYGALASTSFSIALLSNGLLLMMLITYIAGKARVRAGSQQVK